MQQAHVSFCHGDRRNERTGNRVTPYEAQEAYDRLSTAAREHGWDGLQTKSMLQACWGQRSLSRDGARSLIGEALGSEAEVGSRPF
jgi:hypothetical protein